jgi:hypothetical protein
MKPLSMHELIVDALRTSPDGLTLDETKVATLVERLGESAARKDLTAAKAVYEMVAVLEKSRGAKAARSLLRLMINGVETTAPKRSKGWRART